VILKGAGNIVLQNIAYLLYPIPVFCIISCQVDIDTTEGVKVHLWRKGMETFIKTIMNVNLYKILSTFIDTFAKYSFAEVRYGIVL